MAGLIGESDPTSLPWSLEPRALNAGSHGRYRRVAWTALSIGGGRGIAYLSSLVFAPLVLRYLGAERFGLWATLTSLVGLLGFSDLGFGNGLVSAVAEAYGRDDAEALRRAIATAFYALLAIAVVLGVVFLTVYSIVPWNSLLNNRSAAVDIQLNQSVAVMAGCFLFSLPLVVAEKIQFGVQRGYIAGAWLAAGNLIGLAVAVAAIELHAGLPMFVAATIGGPAVAAGANCLTWFRGRWRAYAPRRRDINRKAAGALLRMGSLFLAFNVAVAVAYVSDPLVISQVLGPKATGQYWLHMRLFSLIPVACTLVLTPLWPAYGEALARNDTAWAVRTLKLSLRIGVACSVPVALLLALAGPKLLRWWGGTAAHPDQGLFSALAVWGVLWVIMSTLQAFLTGARIVRLQSVCALVMASLNLPLSIVLARQIGVSGVVWASVATYAVFMVVPYAVVVPRLIGRMQLQ